MENYKTCVYSNNFNNICGKSTGTRPCFNDRMLLARASWGTNWFNLYTAFTKKL